MVKDEENREEEDLLDPKRYRTILDPVAHYVMARPGTENILLSFINAVFANKNEPSVQKITVLNPFNAKSYRDDKLVVVDILAEDESQRKFNIEFQVWDHKYFIERGIYYWARVYSRQLEDSKQYRGLRPVVSILLTDFQNSVKFGGLYKQLANKIHQSFSMGVASIVRLKLREGWLGARTSRPHQKLGKVLSAWRLARRVFTSTKSTDFGQIL